MKRISFYLFIAFVLLLQSCIKEDSSSCKSELLLRFRYTLNNQHTNLFDSNVNRVTLFIFDNNGKYVDSLSEQGSQLTNDYVMHIPLPVGQYTVIAYGSDFTTYSTGEITNPGDPLAPLTKGVTDINNFRMELLHNSDLQSNLTPLSTPDNLYAGLAVNAVSDYNNSDITDVELIEDTKKIKVEITGTDVVGAPLDIYITAANGRYQFDNSIDTNFGTFKYTPTTTQLPNYQESDLKIMRLVLGQSPMLVIKNSVTQEVLYNENIIDQILLTNQYVTQEDFDREDEFVFEIKLTNDIAVTVTINGWTVHNINPDID